MPQKVEAIIDRLVTLEAALTGVEAAYDETPESIGSLPAFINYPLRGDAAWLKFDGCTSNYTIAAELHVARIDLPEAEKYARPIINPFITAVFGDRTLDSTVSEVEAIRWRYGTATFAEEIHLVVFFEVDCRVTDDPF